MVQLKLTFHAGEGESLFEKAFLYNVPLNKLYSINAGCSIFFGKKGKYSLLQPLNAKVRAKRITNIVLQRTLGPPGWIESSIKYFKMMFCKMWTEYHSIVIFL